MDEIEKLLRKAHKKDRERLLAVMVALRKGDVAGLQIKKLAGSALYRVRVGNFRISFVLDKEKKTIEIVRVRLRNEATYK